MVTLLRLLWLLVSVVTLIGFPFHVICVFSLETRNIFSLLCIISVLTMICYVEFLFCSCLRGVLCTSCVCMGMSFLSLEFSSLILIRIWSTTLIWNSSSSPSCDSEWVFPWCSMLPICHLHVFYTPCFYCLIPLIYHHLLTSCLLLGPLFLYIFP